MIETESELLAYLDAHDIPYQRVEHPPVFTCEQAQRLRPDLPAVSTKNLFLCDKKARRFFLVMTACEKRMDFKILAEQIGVPKLRFGAEDNLNQLLGVTRGAVTVLGLVNDIDQRVSLWVDAEIWNEANFLCHPLVNTATLVLSKASLERFFILTRHSIQLAASIRAAGNDRKRLRSQP